LAEDQIASYVSDDKHLILKGASTFTAVLEVTAGATSLNPNDLQDKTPSYEGSGHFTPAKTW